VLRRVLEHNMKQMTRGWRKLNNGELHNLYCLMLLEFDLFIVIYRCFKVMVL
jgi:hypothetical protein